MIRDIIAQEVGGDAPADDMDGGDIEGMGDEAPIEEPGMEAEPGMEGDEEEIDLDELIRELESISEEPTVNEEEVEEGKKEDEDKMEESADETVEEDTSVQVNHESDGKDYNINRVADLKEALETIETLKKELNEVNILNAKLLYVNKIFKAQNLSESQKVNVIAAFDKAETVKEVKLVFETVVDNVGTKKETTIKEHKGSASKATGTTASKPEVIQLSEAVLRMQKLAGIIK
jgi:prolyl oligopeptidase PreP (S9A serine peptidase family)